MRRIANRIKERTRKEIRKELDTEFSLYIRSRDMYSCFFAGKDSVRCGGSMQCNHLVSRGNDRLRWDESNAVCGCGGHNTYYHFHEAKLHEFVRRASDVFKKKFKINNDMNFMDMLLLISHSENKYSSSALELLLNDIKNKRAKLIGRIRVNNED